MNRPEKKEGKPQGAGPQKSGPEGMGVGRRGDRPGKEMAQGSGLTAGMLSTEGQGTGLGPFGEPLMFQMRKLRPRERNNGIRGL